MSVNTQISGKLSLKSTTRISLNDRFKILRQNVSPKPFTQPGTSVSPQASQHYGSARNKRLALQMANRPSVMAALKIKNKSIKQRLGTSNSTGRSPRSSGRFNNAGRPSPRQSSTVRLNRSNFVGTKRVAVRKQRTNVNKQTGPPRRSTVGKRLFTSPRSTPSGSQNPRFNQRKQAGIKARVNLQQRKAARQRLNQRQRIGNQKRQPKLGKPRWQRNKPLDKTQLDKDLDAYMAKTKTHLDAELDAYMAEATTN